MWCRDRDACEKEERSLFSKWDVEVWDNSSNDKKTKKQKTKKNKKLKTKSGFLVWNLPSIQYHVNI